VIQVRHPPSFCAKFIISTGFFWQASLRQYNHIELNLGAEIKMLSNNMFVKIFANNMFV